MAGEFRARRALTVLSAYIAAQILLAVVAAFATGIVLGLAQAYGAPRARDEVLRIALIVGVAAGMLGAGAIAYAMTRRMTERGGLEPMDVFGCFRAGWTPTLAGMLAGLACGIAFAFLATVFPPPPDFKPGPVTAAVAESRTVLYAWALLAVGFAPPIEEFVFRGVLWTGLSRSWGPIAAAIAVTALFVAMHLVEAWRYPPALVAIGAMGLAALAFRVRYGSLVPSIALHAAYNTIVTLGMLRHL